MTLTELKARIALADPDEDILYYEGFLVVDIDRAWASERDRLIGLAKCARDAYKYGKVTLWQRRIRDSVYHYYARKLPAPYRPAPFEGCYLQAELAFSERTKLPRLHGKSDRKRKIGA